MKVWKRWTKGLFPFAVAAVGVTAGAAWHQAAFADGVVYEDRTVYWAGPGHKVVDLVTIPNLLKQGQDVAGCTVASVEYEHRLVNDGTFFDREVDKVRKDVALEIIDASGETFRFKAFVWPKTALSSYSSNDFVMLARGADGTPADMDVLVYSGKVETSWSVEYARLEILLSEGEVKGLVATITPTRWEGIPFVVGAHVPQPERAKKLDCL